MSNVVRLIPRGTKRAQEQTLPRIDGVDNLIANVMDWAENNEVDIYKEDFVFFCADFMQRLQMMSHLAKRNVA